MKTNLPKIEMRKVDMASNKNPDFDPLGEHRKAARKAARKLALRSLWSIAKSLILHYVITLAGVAVIAASGFHGTFRAALSATALGLLARWFLPNKARTQADALRQPQPIPGLEFPAGVVELTPEQLKDFLGNLPEQADLSAYDTPAPKASPYL